MNYSFEDIKKTIYEVISSPEVTVAREAFVGAVSATNPSVSVTAITANKFLEKLDEFLINRMLVGLSSGLNQEKQINELYRYVTSSKQRALQVGIILKRTIMSQSPKVAVVYGIALKAHVGRQQRDFTRDELIACNALLNSNDYDLESFEILMKNNVREDERFGKIIDLDLSQKDRIEEELNTCIWGSNNRLFYISPIDMFSVNQGSGTLEFRTDYRVQEAAMILLGWIEEAKQVWDY